MSLKKANFILLSAILFINTLGYSQKQIQSPSDFLTYTYGSRIPTFQAVHSYFSYLSDTSPSVKLVPYGKSYEGRPLVLVFITSEENMEHLQDIRENHLLGYDNQVQDPSDKPVILWMSYSVHGNEAGATSASLNTAYTLLTQKKDLLKDAIIIMDPCVNPDGYARYSQWYNQVAASPPQSRSGVIEHQEPWPTGRVNHYHFDLNRDWVWASQVETQQRLPFFHRWMPHVHIDFHEQYPENNYFFPPAAEPIHPRITQGEIEIMNAFGDANSSEFDKKKWLYYTEELFDLYYPSYGDTYPLFNGAIGMTYEQAGHGIAGVSYRLRNGTTLDLIDRIRHHTQTGITTIEKSIAIKDDILKNWNNYFRSAWSNAGEEIQSYALLCKTAQQRESLKKLLALHRIKTQDLPANVDLQGFSYRFNDNRRIQSNSYTLLIDCNQPESRLIHVLMEPESTISSGITYDITAWAIPYMWGIETISMKYVPTFAEADIKKSKENSSTIARKSAIAFKRVYKALEDIQDVALLMKNGYDIRAFKAPGKDPYFLILKPDNPEKSFENLSVEWKAITDGRELDYDLGSAHFNLLEKPRVILVKSDDADKYSYGFIWHYFEQELHYPIYRIPIDELGEYMHRYNTIVFPDGNYALDTNLVNKLSSFMKKGGKLILIKGASQIMNPLNTLKLEKKPLGQEKSTSGKVISYLDQKKEGSSLHNPGAIMRIKWDNEAPLGWGMENYLDCLILGNKAYKYLDGGVQVGYFNEWEMGRGYITPEIKEHYEHSMRFSYKKYGRGKIIYMLDDPLFRSFWESGKQLFTNAIILM